MVDSAHHVQLHVSMGDTSLKCQILFSGKKKKKQIQMSSAEIFTQHAMC